MMMSTPEQAPLRLAPSQTVTRCMARFSSSASEVGAAMEALAMDMAKAMILVACMVKMGPNESKIAK